jgi:hypothetical protein
MKQSLKAMLAWEADRHSLNPTGTHTFNGRTLRVIGGHRDAGQTACPGNKVEELLPNFRRKVADMMGDGRTATRINLAASSAIVRHGRSVETNGILTDASGQPLANRPVTIYRKYIDGLWKVHTTAKTGPQGEFSTTVTPRRKVALSASFSTNPGYWGSDSRVARVSVKHVVTLAPSDRDSDSKGLYHYSPADKRAVVGGQVSPAHTGERVRVRLLERFAKGSYNEVARKWPTLDESGGFSQSFLLVTAKSGTRYRVAAKMPGDGAHERGYSGPSYLVVD